MRSTTPTFALSLFFASSMLFSEPTPVDANQLELLNRSTLTEQALSFADGPATRFSNTVNGRTHQQAALTTCQGYQYVTFVDAERRICLGRRKLPSGSWEVIQFQDHRFESNDSHNTAVVGICEKDGTIHMAFDHHASQLNYRVSQQQVATQPESVKWDATLFGPVTHTLGSVATDSQVTYPRFFAAPNGNLMLYYRAITSGNGDGMIEEYDGDKQDWTPGLGKFIARDMGTYSADGKTSQYRCPYMDSLSYAGKRLHASWIWRDRFEKTDSANQHDLCYAYSDDDGRTWNNSNGDPIGKTGETFIHLNSPGLVVAPIPIRSGLTNANTHYAFADGSIHIVLRHRSVEKRISRYYHYWRNNQGAWHHEMLPFVGMRPKLVGAPDNTLILVYTDEDRLFVAEGSPDQAQTHWKWADLKLPRPQSILGEAVVDLPRWNQEQVLSIYSQESPTKDVQTDRTEPVDGIASRLDVIDYRVVKVKASESDFVSLFDGESLDGWIGDHPFWSVRDGVLVGEITPETRIEKNRFLIYEGAIPADFEFMAEFRISQNGNSGINYRSERVGGLDFYALEGYQCDLDGKNRYTGSNYEERGRTTLASIGESVVLPTTKTKETSPFIQRNQWTAGVREPLPATKEQLLSHVKQGEWNKVRIIAQGDRLEHYVNGQLMSRVIDEDEVNRRSHGQLGVQVHVGPPMTIEFRKLRVRPIQANGS